MKKLTALAIPAILAAGIASANAADIRGRVDSVDTATQTFTLKGGATFRYDENTPVQDLVPDTKVKVQYKSTRGAYEARKVKIISGPRN